MFRAHPSCDAGERRKLLQQGIRVSPQLSPDSLGQLGRLGELGLVSLGETWLQGDLLAPSST